MKLTRLLLLPAFALPTFASAQVVSVAAADAGWYDSTGFSNPANQNYAAGQAFDLTRNFFVFELPSFSGTIAGATLRLYNPAFGYDSPDAAEWFSVFDVTTNVTQLIAGNGGVSAFDDLGSGSLFGSRAVTAADSAAWIEIELNSAFLAALQNGPARIAVGGALTSLDPLNTSWNEVVFAFSDAAVNAPTLDVRLAAVPEPSSYGVVGAAMVAASVLWRARRRRALRLARPE